MSVFPNYEDLALKIEAAPEPGELQVRLLHSPFGGNQPTAFRLPFDGQEPPEILRALEATVRRSGHDGSQSPRGLSLLEAESSRASVTPRQIGQALFDSLFVGSTREIFLNSLELVSSQESCAGLRIRLVIDPAVAARFSAWPWELLYRHETRDYLSRNVATPIVRQLEVRRAALTPRPINQLRLLVVLSNPAGVIPLQVEREKDLIRSALGALQNVDLHFLEKPTIERLRLELHRGFDALHFVGHGDLDELGQGRLMFEDEDGGARPILGTVLADTLKGRDMVRVVLLNACETACLPRDVAGLDPFSGTASALVMGGIRAVIAMQFPITDRAAVRFSKAFYSYLAAGDPLEAAVTEGRMAIYHAQPQSWEWATPVLFLGVPHGQLFTLSAESQNPAGSSAEGRSVTAPAPAAAASLEGALELLDGDRYDRALEALGQVRKTDPDNPAAAYYAALARLEGRRPRATRLDVIKEVEADLETASDLSGAEAPAHFWFLQALIKHDFYRFKGMRVRPPSLKEILFEARSAHGDPVELKRLLDHVPTPSSPIREAIEARRKESAPR